MSMRCEPEVVGGGERTRIGKANGVSYGNEDPRNTKGRSRERLTGELHFKEIHDTGTKVLPKGDYYSLLQRVFQSILQVMSSTVFLK